MDTLKWEPIFKGITPETFFRLKHYIFKYKFEYTFKYDTLRNLILSSLMTLQNSEPIVFNNWLGII